MSGLGTRLLLGVKTRQTEKVSQARTLWDNPEVANIIKFV